MVRSADGGLLLNAEKRQPGLRFGNEARQIDRAELHLGFAGF
jgi:hypothetical protein